MTIEEQLDQQAQIQKDSDQNENLLQQNTAIKQQQSAILNEKSAIQQQLEQVQSEYYMMKSSYKVMLILFIITICMLILWFVAFVIAQSKVTSIKAESFVRIEQQQKNLLDMQMKLLDEEKANVQQKLTQQAFPRQITQQMLQKDTVLQDNLKKDNNNTYQQWMFTQQKLSSKVPTGSAITGPATTTNFPPNALPTQ